MANIEVLKAKVDTLNDTVADATRSPDINDLREIREDANLQMLKAQHAAQTERLHTVIQTRAKLLRADPALDANKALLMVELERTSDAMTRNFVGGAVTGTVGNAQLLARENPALAAGGGLIAGFGLTQAINWFRGRGASARADGERIRSGGGTWWKVALGAVAGFAGYHFFMGNGSPSATAAPDAAAAPPGSPAEAARKSLAESMRAAFAPLPPGEELFAVPGRRTLNIDGIPVVIGGNELTVNGRLVKISARRFLNATDAEPIPFVPPLNVPIKGMKNEAAESLAITVEKPAIAGGGNASMSVPHAQLANAFDSIRSGRPYVSDITDGGGKKFRVTIAA